MHYTPPNLRAFLTPGEAEQQARDLGPWPLYALTAVVGVLTIPDTIFELTGWEYFRNWNIPVTANWALTCSLAAAFLGGLRVLYQSLEGLFEGRVGADLAVAIAAVAAIVLGETWVAAEVVFIAMFGECLEGFIYARATREITRMLELAPQIAHVIRSGVEVDVPINEVEVEEVVVVRPGERLPVDGTVLNGNSAIDQAALTGESLPVDKQPGDEVFAGTLNQYGAIEVRANRVGSATTLGTVLRMVTEAQQNKAPLERQADLYARWFLPAVLSLAALTFLYTNWGNDTWSTWNPTLAVLVVACPCALILATPAAVLASMAWLAHRGVVIKGSLALERLASVDALAFDKTGTLTTGRLSLDRIEPLDDTTADELVIWAASAESRSEHVLAQLFKEEAKRRELAPWQLIDFESQPGLGISAQLAPADVEPSEANVRRVLIGNPRLLAGHGVEITPEAEVRVNEFDGIGATILLLAVDGRVRGVMAASDTVRSEAAEVLRELRALGIRKMALLTGDRQAVAEQVSERLPYFDAVQSEQLPADKAHWLAEWRGEAGRVGMIGDGINDAPALATADVGLALGGVGSDLAAEAGDLVLMGDPLAPLPGLLRLSRQMVRVIRQNIVIFAFGVNATAILLANLGWLSPVAGAFYHLTGSVLVLLNAMRLLWFERWDEMWIGRGVAAIDRAAEQLSLVNLIEFLEVHGRRVLKVAAAAALLIWACWNIHIIGPEERAIVTRYGRFRSEQGPGLIWRMPPPFERVYRAEPYRVRSLPVGLMSATAANADSMLDVVEWDTVHDASQDGERREESLLLTGDEVLVEIAASVNYRIAEGQLRQYLFGVENPEQLLKDLVEHSLRLVAARHPLDDLLTSSREDLEAETTAKLNELATHYELGLQVLDLSIGDIHPPLEVVSSYREVASAYEEQHTAINRAETKYHETVLLAGGSAVYEELKRRRMHGDHGELDLRKWLDRAGGQAAEQLQQAQTERIQRQQHATGDARRFVLRQEAFRGAPLLTQIRLYWQATEKAFQGRPAWILDPDVVGRRSLLLTDPSMLAPRIFAAPGFGEALNSEIQPPPETSTTP